MYSSCIPAPLLYNLHVHEHFCLCGGAGGAYAVLVRRQLQSAAGPAPASEATNGIVEDHSDLFERTETGMGPSYLLASLL